ncbi:uncharacterized protein LOC130645984 [Hydractinia symbiolongicarpus]|uniref:uncharacterized protein LOC130645984 n=1 Tax=Hydractinia symbiolongicarpus TaxID=13093 RepID=UPI00254DFE06|nr:uncharacterized protein LOC130645984 [Hydractinia symbiolongicarpus]
MYIVLLKLHIRLSLSLLLVQVLALFIWTSPLVILVMHALMSYEDFFNRKGAPTLINSDNGSNFTSTLEFASAHGTQWTFNVEAAHWQDGFFERLVQSVKRCLRKCSGKYFVNYEELLTFLAEIERILNNRPLTFFNDDVNERNLNAQWLNEYVVNLRETHKHCIQSSKNVISVNDIVLIDDNRHKRSFWKLGKVIALITGKDNNVRAAKVEYVTNNFVRSLNRPVNKLYPVELS